MPRLSCLFALLCTLCCADAFAQEESFQWQRYHIDSTVSIEMPLLFQPAEQRSDNSITVSDTTIGFSVSFVNLEDEKEQLQGKTKKQQAEHVYSTYISKLRRHTRCDIVVKTWQRHKLDYCMLMWHPASGPETDYYLRIRPNDWGYLFDVLPPLVRFERLLFYNNKLYIFALICISPEYHDMNYYERGGLPEDEVNKIKNQFFKSIKIGKLPGKT